MAEIPSTTPEFDPKGLIRLSQDQIEMFSSLASSVYFQVLFPDNYHITPTRLDEVRLRIFEECDSLEEVSGLAFSLFRRKIKESKKILGKGFVTYELFGNHIPLLIMAGGELGLMHNQALLQDEIDDAEYDNYQKFTDFYETVCEAYLVKSFPEHIQKRKSRKELAAVIDKSFVFGSELLVLLSSNRDELLGMPQDGLAVYRDWFDRFNGTE